MESVMKVWHVILLLICVSFVGCKTRIKYIPIEGDTKIVEKEILIPIVSPVDSANIRALLECDENGKIVLRWLDVEKSKNMRLQFQIDSLGNLLAKATTAPDTVFLPSKEILVEKNTPVPYPVEKELGWWQQTKINYGGWAIVVIIITILIVFGKMIYKLKK